MLAGTDTALGTRLDALNTSATATNNAVTAAGFCVGVRAVTGASGGCELPRVWSGDVDLKPGAMTPML